MGFIRKHTGLDITGNEASRQAERAQIAAGEKASGIIQKNLDPYVQAGQQALQPLMSFTTDPNAQADFAINNPLFKALAADTTRRLFANQAAKGKLGSGETAVDLNNQLIPLGAGLAQQHGDNLYRTAVMGQNAATQQATQLADNYTNMGNARAAGIVGRNNNTLGLIKNVAAVAAAPFTGGMSLGLLSPGNSPLGVGQQAQGSGVAVGQMPSNVASYTPNNPLFMGA